MKRHTQRNDKGQFKKREFQIGDVVRHIDADEVGREGKIVAEHEEDDIVFNYGPAPYGIAASRKGSGHKWYCVKWYDTGRTSTHRADTLR